MKNCTVPYESHYYISRTFIPFLLTYIYMDIRLFILFFFNNRSIYFYWRSMSESVSGMSSVYYYIYMCRFIFLGHKISLFILSNSLFSKLCNESWVPVLPVSMIWEDCYCKFSEYILTEIRIWIKKYVFPERHQHKRDCSLWN